MNSCWAGTRKSQTVLSSRWELDSVMHGWNLDQDLRQDNEQGPLQKPAMDEESETLVILQL